jgi:D-sedoheptulose 7-phosphate isomerase
LAHAIDADVIEDLAERLARGRECGRLFILGIGGSAANASHAVNDFRKLCGIEAYAPTDNVSELTARTNDEGWNTAFVGWLRTNHLHSGDAVFVLSVGGGSASVSQGLIQAVEYAEEQSAQVYAIIGKADGKVAYYADCCIVVPELFPHHLTPHAEECQSIILHCLVSHPLLQQQEPTWERLSVSRST